MPTHGNLAIGIDIGGTGIKAGLVDVARGRLVGKRARVDTPQPATPAAVEQSLRAALAALQSQTVAEYGADRAPRLDRLPAGTAFPGVVKEGVVGYAPNLDPSWIGAHLGELAGRLTGCSHVLNDADAAGLAEMAYGAGRRFRRGTVVITTLGTGIGTALFTAGRLFPFSELGHIELDGAEAEAVAARSVAVREGLDFPAWAQRLQRYYAELEKILNPDAFIVGGGVSKRHAEFLPLIHTNAALIPAQLRNEAGIVGAALFAAHGGKPKAGVPKRLRGKKSR
jgi:polyphosphate glucokinase